MKNLLQGTRHLAGLLAIVLVIGGCHKNDPTPTTLVGKWRWLSSKGGMTGKEERTPTNTGTTRRLTFHADSTFVLCHVGPCGLTSTYNMKAGRNYFTGKPDRVLYLNQRVIVDQGEEHIINFPYLIQECSNTLIIVQNGPDGYTDTYVRE